MISLEFLNQKVTRIIHYLKNNQYEDLEIEIKELASGLFKEKEEFVRISDFKILSAELKEGFKLFEKRLEAIDKRFEDLIYFIDKRFDDTNKRFEAIDKRFEDLNKRIHFLQWLMVFLTTLLFSAIAYFHNKNTDILNKILEHQNTMIEFFKKASPIIK